MTSRSRVRRGCSLSSQSSVRASASAAASRACRRRPAPRPIAGISKSSAANPAARNRLRARDRVASSGRHLRTSTQRIGVPGGADGFSALEFPMRHEVIDIVSGLGWRWRAGLEAIGVGRRGERWRRLRRWCRRGPRRLSRVSRRAETLDPWRDTRRRRWQNPLQFSALPLSRASVSRQSETVTVTVSWFPPS